MKKMAVWRALPSGPLFARGTPARRKSILPFPVYARFLLRDPRPGR